jgi:hypothetical protein
MKKIVTLSVIISLCLMTGRLYAETDTLTCPFFMYSKASVGCNVYVVYSGNAPGSATYNWNWDGGNVIYGSGPGYYYVQWTAPGYKTVTLQVIYNGDTCSSSHIIHIVPAPQVYNVTGGGSYPYGGTGVAIGLSGSEANYIYYLFLGTSMVTSLPGTGSVLNFGVFTAAGTYTCKAKVNSSSTACLVSMSDSAVVTILGYVPSQYICMVTFDTTSQRNMIVWNKVTGPHLSHFNIYKQTASENVYSKIAQVPYNSFSTYVDTTTNPIVMAQKYEMSVTDSSGNESTKSPYHKTVHLEVSPGMQGFNLIWNTYEGFTFHTYNIHRKLNPGPWQLIDSIASDQISYTDPYFTSGLATYYIEVIRYMPCNPSMKSGMYESIVSNTMTSAPLGITEINTARPLVYPNPVQQKVNIIFPSSRKGIGNVEIYSMDGRKYLEQVISQPKAEIDVAILPTGIYFMKIITENSSGTTKIVKE